MASRFAAFLAIGLLSLTASLGAQAPQRGLTVDLVYDPQARINFSGTASPDITWLDADTLKLETDFGTQTRLFEFGAPPPATGAPTWQGVTTAAWVMAAGAGRGQGAAAPRFGSMKSVTRRLRAGYLRKNGVPYSSNAAFTEYWDVHTRPNGDQWMVVTNTVDDPVNLQIPWITSLHFKKERDASKWDPTPCSARF